MDNIKTVEQIKKHEGMRLKPYKCTAGKTTIGYGRNLEDIGISKDEAEYLLDSDIVRVANSIMNCKVLYFYSLLNDARKAVMVNMVFNLGLSRFLKFEKTIEYIKNREYAKASEEMMDSRWAKQVGNRANQLAEQMLNGEWV